MKISISQSTKLLDHREKFSRSIDEIRNQLNCNPLFSEVAVRFFVSLKRIVSCVFTASGFVMDVQGGYITWSGVASCGVSVILYLLSRRESVRLRQIQNTLALPTLGGQSSIKTFVKYTDLP